MGFITNLLIKLRGDNKNLKKSLKDSEKSTNKFGGAIKKIGGFIAGAFAIGALVRFGKELVKISAKAQGIENAFEKLNRPDLLSNLIKSTRGTVDNITLMQKAVQARNFQIPLEKLPTYFEFATNRAIETGEAVDYMTDSIVMGVARKSIPILDNLGITTVQIQEEMEKTGDFTEAVTNIMVRGLQESGNVADTTATKLARINARWENMKKRIGDAIIESGLFMKALETLETVAYNVLKLLDPKAAMLMRETVDLQEDLKDVEEEKEKILKRIHELELKKVGTLKIQVNKRSVLNKQIDTEYKKLDEQYELEKLITAEINKRTKKPDKEKAPNRFRVAPVQGVGMPGQINDTTIFGDIMNPERHNDLMSNLREQSSELQGLENSWRNVGDTVNGVAAMMYDSMMMLSDVIADSLGMLVEGLVTGELDGAFKDILGNFGQFIQDIGKMLVAYGTSMLAFSILSKNPDPVSAGLAIAAGLSAIAIGAAIKGAASGGQEALRGGSSGGYSGGGGAAVATPQNLTVQVVGTLKGSDIAISSRRYSNQLGTTT